MTVIPLWKHYLFRITGMPSPSGRGSAHPGPALPVHPSVTQARSISTWSRLSPHLVPGFDIYRVVLPRSPQILNEQSAILPKFRRWRARPGALLNHAKGVGTGFFYVAGQEKQVRKNGSVMRGLRGMEGCGARSASGERDGGN